MRLSQERERAWQRFVVAACAQVAQRVVGANEVSPLQDRQKTAIAYLQSTGSGRAASRGAQRRREIPIGELAQAGPSDLENVAPRAAGVAGAQPAPAQGPGR